MGENSGIAAGRGGIERYPRDLGETAGRTGEHTLPEHRDFPVLDHDAAPYRLIVQCSVFGFGARRTALIQIK
jgi:hypothetical protein